MENYAKLYHLLFNAITDALEQMNVQNFGSAKETLVSAQQKSEELYITTTDEAGTLPARRAQQSRPRTQSAARQTSLAPHDSKARLRVVTKRRDSWRSHVHRTYIAQRVQSFKLQTANVKAFLLDGRCIMRHKCRKVLCTCAKKRKKETRNPRRSARASCCVVCVFLGGRKSHRGSFPFASIKIPVNLG